MHECTIDQTLRQSMPHHMHELLCQSNAPELLCQGAVSRAFCLSANDNSRAYTPELKQPELKQPELSCLSNNNACANMEKRYDRDSCQRIIPEYEQTCMSSASEMPEHK
mmetsp:Transcript_47033/g.98627  ORF Transcript_47033/g.98627 Transcript_47033/m.98627 type:complete len:109 (-) Transcript_47033:724-1050(-)